MHHYYPQMFNTTDQSGKFLHTEPEHQSLESIRASIRFHHHDTQSGLPSYLVEKLDWPLISCHKSYGDHYNSAFTCIQNPPSASQFSFTNSLNSIVESFLSTTSEESYSSSDMHCAFPSHSDTYSEFLGHHNMSLFDQSQQHEMPAQSAADEEHVKPLDISFHRNPQSDKHRTRACRRVSSSINSNSRTRKRRIRWTKDLHEPFVTIVNSLGGPEKAKPKSILQMMGSDVLSISHIKSHLQKYRSTTYVRKDLQVTRLALGISERSVDEGNHLEGVSELQLKIHKQIEESLQLQREVQKSLHEQLEIQQNLHLLIKQHRKQLKIMSNHQKQGGKLQVCVPR